MNIPKTPLAFILFCIRPHRGKMILFFVLSGLGIASWAFAPYVIAQLVNYLPNADGLDPKILWFVAGFAGLRFLDEWFWRGSEIVVRGILPRIAVSAREHLFHRVMKHDYRFFVNSSSGQVGHWINDSFRLVDGIIESTIWSVWPMTLNFVLSFILLLTVGWQVALVFLVWIIGLVIYLALAGRTRSRLSEIHSDAKSKAGGVVVDALTNYLAVRTFSAGKREDANMRRSLNEVETTWYRSWKFATLMHAVKGNSAALASAICLALAVWLFVEGKTSLGGIVLLITYITTISQQVWELGWQMDNYFRNFGEMRNILGNLLSVEDKPTFREGAKHLKLADKSDIIFDSVAFAYPERPDKPTLNDFNLTIKHGEKLGLVGHSGAGKTTLVALLLGFYSAEQGGIRFGKHDIRDLPEDQWRELVSYVPQDTSLFNRSVRENIAYAKPNATDAEIASAIKKAHAKEFIEALPNGLDTIIGERGVKLSGGQRQRIAIARAILRNAPIMVLDEATSALDSASEQAIQAALSVAMKGKTVIVVAHRLSTLRHLDKIAVLEKGAVEEFGSHDELLKQKGTYADLWQRQRDGFIVS